MDNRIKKVTAQIGSGPPQSLSVRSLAVTVNLSESRFRHLFKEQVGVSPVKYIRRLKMEQAKDLLENTFLRVKEISNLVGAGNSNSFIRAFKRMYGVSPAEYRAARSGEV